MDIHTLTKKMEQDPTSEKWVYVPPASPEDSQRPTSSSFSDYPEEGQRPFKRKNDNYRGNSRGRGRGGFYNVISMFDFFQSVF